MKRLPPIILVALCLLLYGCDEPAIVSHESDMAALGSAKGPKGGGKDPPPDGMVYFCCDGAIHQMDGSGGSVAAFPASVTGIPSREEHGGLRWFLHVEPVAGTYSDGVPRQEVFATGARPGTASTTTVQLTDDPSVHPRDDDPHSTRWSPGDAKIGFKGRRLDATGRVTEGGLFVLDVTFDAAGSPAPAGPPDLAVPTAISPKPEWCEMGSGNVCEESLLFGFDWSPSMDRIVYADGGVDVELPVILRITGADLDLAVGANPLWSPPTDPDFPDGRIVFSEEGVRSLWTVNPDGSNLQEVVSVQDRDGNRSIRLVNYPAWSPTGEHFVYRLLVHRLNIGQGITSDIYRVEADGSGKTCLTCRDFESMGPLGWW